MTKTEKKTLIPRRFFSETNMPCLEFQQIAGDKRGYKFHYGWKTGGKNGTGVSIMISHFKRAGGGVMTHEQVYALRDFLNDSIKLIEAKVN